MYKTVQNYWKCSKTVNSGWNGQKRLKIVEKSWNPLETHENSWKELKTVKTDNSEKTESDGTHRQTAHRHCYWETELAPWVNSVKIERRRQIIRYYYFKIFWMKATTKFEKKILFNFFKGIFDVDMIKNIEFFFGWIAICWMSDSHLGCLCMHIITRPIYMTPKVWSR